MEWKLVWYTEMRTRNINTTVPFNMNRCTEQFVTWCHVLNNTILYLILLTYHPIQPKFTNYFFFHLLRRYTALLIDRIPRRNWLNVKIERKHTFEWHDSVIMSYAHTQSHIFRCTYVEIIWWWCEKFCPMGENIFFIWRISIKVIVI